MTGDLRTRVEALRDEWAEAVEMTDGPLGLGTDHAKGKGEALRYAAGRLSAVLDADPDTPTAYCGAWYMVGLGDWRCTLDREHQGGHGQRPDTPTADDPECCASGRCEVCSPGFDWARNGALPDAPVDDGLVEREPFVGSMRVMDALLAVFTDHIYLSETPDDGPGYLWCGCGWRSDQAGGTAEAAGGFLRTHMANATHAALVPVIDALLAERAGEVEAARQDAQAEIYARADHWRNKFGSSVPVGCIYLDPSAPTEDDLAWLRDVAARGETRQP